MWRFSITKAGSVLELTAHTQVRVNFNLSTHKTDMFLVRLHIKRSSEIPRMASGSQKIDDHTFLEYNDSAWIPTQQCKPECRVDSGPVRIQGKGHSLLDRPEPVVAFLKPHLFI